MSRILLVEDDPTIRSLLVELLGEEGYDVEWASNGRTGIEVACASHPDLILMDLMLPILDGMTATRILKADQATRSIPIIAISAGTNLRIQADDLPADGVVAKPFDLDTLLAAITVQLRRAADADGLDPAVEYRAVGRQRSG